MKTVNLQNIVKLQAFGVTGTWEQKIKRDCEGICQEIAQKTVYKDKTDRVLQLLGFEHVPKPYEAVFLSIVVEPIRKFQMYFILADRSNPNLFFYFNSQSTELMHGEDAIVWVELYIRLLGRAYKNIDSLGVELEDRFHFSSRVPKTKLKQLYALTNRSLETISTEYDYIIDFETVSQWKVTINQCPGLILQIRRYKDHIQYGYQAARALTCEQPTDNGWSLTTNAFLHMNHILREVTRLEQTSD